MNIMNISNVNNKPNYSTLTQSNEITLNTYIIVDNKYLGKVTNVLWNGSGYIIKLIGDYNYLDPIILQYPQLLNQNDTRGYMVVTSENLIEIPNPNNLFSVINNYLLKSELKQLINSKVLKNFNKFISMNSSNIVQPKIQNPITPTKLLNYQIQDMKEDDYTKYILKMISNIFVPNTQIYYIEENPALTNVESRSYEILDEDNLNNVVKPEMIKILESYHPVDLGYYYDFKDSLMYKHISTNNNELINAGIQLIKMIRDNLLITQSTIKFDDGDQMLLEVNLFDFIEFRVTNGYIEMVNKFVDSDFETVSTENCPDLEILTKMYGQPIDYNTLSKIILENKTKFDINKNNQILNEAIQILSLEYLICLQPKVEFLLWTINRIIYAWFADPYLFKNIYKIKVLINLYRARGLKEFNQNADVLPEIIVYPRYGKHIARKVASVLSNYFFAYKRFGMPDSNPTYFNKLDDLMYYTNGSVELKKYIKFILGKNQNNLFTSDLTLVKSNTESNDILF